MKVPSERNTSVKVVEKLSKYKDLERPPSIKRRRRRPAFGHHNENSLIVVTSIKSLIHLVLLYFKNMMKENTV